MISSWLNKILTIHQQEQLRVLVARWLIRFKRLKHASYSSQELNTLLAAQFPQSFKLNTPAGQGTFCLLSAELDMPVLDSHIHIQCFSSFEVVSLGNPIYRAHVVIQLQAKPDYDPERKLVYLHQTAVNDIRLVQDEYSLLNDTQILMNKLLPRPMTSLFTNTVKTTLSLVTAGTSNAAMDYLKLYMSGSKQRVLDYHKPQLEKLITDMVTGDDLKYRLDESNWEENLFAELGKEVAVEEGELRFKF